MGVKLIVKLLNWKLNSIKRKAYKANNSYWEIKELEKEITKLEKAYEYAKQYAEGGKYSGKF